MLGLGIAQIEFAQKVAFLSLIMRSLAVRHNLTTSLYTPLMVQHYSMNKRMVKKESKTRGATCPYQMITITMEIAYPVHEILAS